MRPQVRRAVAHQPFDIAVLLLKVLGTKEHALRPDDLVVPRHSFSLLALVSASPPRSGCRAVDLLRKPPPTRRPLGRSGNPGAPPVPCSQLLPRVSYSFLTCSE